MFFCIVIFYCFSLIVRILLLTYSLTGDKLEPCNYILMLDDQLRNLGFSDNEALVYLELLKLGPQAVSVLSKRTALNRTTIYSVLRSLQRKGVVSTFLKKNVKYYAAEDPNCLVGYADSMKQTFEYKRDQIINEMPNFRALMSMCDFRKPVISFHEGVDAVKQVCYDLFDSDEDVRSFFPLHLWLKSSLRDFIVKNMGRRLRMEEADYGSIIGIDRAFNVSNSTGVRSKKIDSDDVDTSNSGRVEPDLSDVSDKHSSVSDEEKFGSIDTDIDFEESVSRPSFFHLVVPKKLETSGFFVNCEICRENDNHVIFLEMEEFLSGVSHELNIYGDKVLMIHLEPGFEYAVVIEDREIASLHRMMFDIAWEKFLR